MRTRTKVLLLLGAAAATGSAVWALSGPPHLSADKPPRIDEERLVEALCEAWKLGVVDREQLERVGLRVMLQGDDLRAYEQLPPERWPLSVKVAVDTVRTVVGKVKSTIQPVCPT